MCDPLWEAQNAVISTSIKLGLNLKPQALPASALLYKSSFLLSRAWLGIKDVFMFKLQSQYLLIQLTNLHLSKLKLVVHFLNRIIFHLKVLIYQN